MPIAEIKENNYGLQYNFKIENENLGVGAGYSAKLYVWKNSTKYIDGVALTNTFDGTDTHCVYTVGEDDFDIDPGSYFAEITFTKAGFLEDTKSFIFRVLPSVS